METNAVQALQFYLDFLDSVRGGKLSGEALDNSLYHLELLLYQLRAEAVRIIRDSHLDEPLGLSAGFSKFLDGAASVHQGFDSKNEALREEGLSEVELAFPILRDAIDQVGSQKAILGSSKDKLLNLLLNAKDAVAQGTLPEEVFEGILNEFAIHFDKSGRNFRRFLKSGELFPEMQPALQAQVPVYQRAKEALKELRQAWEERSYDRMSPALAQVEEFLNAYVDLSEELTTLLEIENIGEPLEKQCLRCGHSIAVESWACRSCGFIFPQSEAPEGEHFEVKEGSPSTGRISLAPNIEKLVNAVEDFEDGEIDQDEFFAALDWMREKLSRGKEQIKQMLEGLSKPDLSLDAEMFSFFEEYDKGIEQMLTGLSLLRDWATAGIREDRVNGLKFCMDGADKIQRSSALAKKMIEKSESEPDAEGDRFRGSA